MAPRRARRALLTLLLALTCLCAVPRPAFADSAARRRADSAADGVYGRFDGDLDLGLGVGAELGSAGRAALALRGTALYYSIAGVYAAGRIHTEGASARSLFGLGVELRPLFVPRWAKGFEAGPSLLDLTLDSLSLSLGGFWAERAPHGLTSARGFEAGLGFGLPLFERAAGLWLETRGAVRYPDAAAREEAVFVALAWHGFVLTPLAD